MNINLCINVNIYLEWEKKMKTNHKFLKADKYHKQYKIQKNKTLFSLTDTPYNTFPLHFGWRFDSRSHEDEKEVG